jgi:hypothetical protein
MNTALLIEKDGNIKIADIKNVDKLYSICNYRNDTNFEVLHTWNNEIMKYELYGKKKTKGSIKNNYQMPYPIDKEIYYGSLCVIKKMNNSIVNMTMDDWVLIISNFKTRNESNEGNNNSNFINETNNEKSNYNEDDDTNSIKTLMKNREKELTHEEYEEE